MYLLKTNFAKLNPVNNLEMMESHFNSDKQPNLHALTVATNNVVMVLNNCHDLSMI